MGCNYSYFLIYVYVPRLLFHDRARKPTTCIGFGNNGPCEDRYVGLYIRIGVWCVPYLYSCARVASHSIHLAIGPLFIGPLSEVYGRAHVLQLANMFYLGMLSIPF